MPDLKWLVSGMIAGLCLGAVFVAEADPRVVVLDISMVILWFTARYFLAQQQRSARAADGRGVDAGGALGVWAGKQLHDRLDEQRLYFWCYVLVGIAGLRLFIDSATKLIASCLTLLRPGHKSGQRLALAIIEC
jgi:uncharacterized membrane protein YfcA